MPASAARRRRACPGDKTRAVSGLRVIPPVRRVCASTWTGDLESYSSRYEDYMGNWGNTLDRWYHRAAVIVWPCEQGFANRAET